MQKPKTIAASLESLQQLAAVGGAVVDLVRESGLLKPRRRRAKPAKAKVRTRTTRPSRPTDLPAGSIRRTQEPAAS